MKASVWHGAHRRAADCLRAAILRHLALAACILMLLPLARAQSGAQPGWLQTVAAFPLAAPGEVGGLSIHQRTAATQPFTVAGPCGAFVGYGDGTMEAWAWPIKLLSHFRIAAQLQDYPVPIDVNEQSAEISVQPDHTTLTFAHAAFTVREILFATRCSHEGDGGVVALFQISSIRPLTLTFSFTPEVERMWPAPNFNAPSPEWVPLGAHSGYYVLHTDSDALAAAVAMPGTEPGILEPYQERPHFYPLQLVLHYDPQRDGNRYFPLLMTAASTAQTAAKAALGARLESMATGVAAAYGETAAYWRHFFAARVQAETPDPRVNQALGWAEVSIDQLKVRHGAETGLVAGLYSSGDSNRPGFGWFFGRDSLFTLYAVDSYGDFALTREEIDFLLARQRADGKIMHEFSQTAELVDWAHTPYEYAAADSTPLLLMLLEDYARRSGDVAYLQQHWAQIALAWNFERTHDSDGDGIYDNSQGTGWVESWPPGMPHQEIYLAALDEQASQAYAALAKLAGKPDEGAAARAKAVAATILHEYQPQRGENGGMYAFSYNGTVDGKMQRDTTATIYPAIAWWQGDYALPGDDAMFRRWASAEFSTDWGTRDLGDHDAFYDPISYHQGSVWPLFTGWVSLAEYRTGRTLAGYQHLMQNLDMSWAQDLGAVTELLSGQYFTPLGRSTTHQLWSSAMVLTPALRGLFGVSYDAQTDTLTVDPHLPAAWPGATLRHVPVSGDRRVTLHYARDGAVLRVRVEGEGGAPPPHLAGPESATATGGELRLPLPGVELGVPAELPLPGSLTTQLKVLEQHSSAHSATWVLEAQAGTSMVLPLRVNGSHEPHAEGASLLPDPPEVNDRPIGGDALLPTTSASLSATGMRGLAVRFPAGSGYVQQTVTVRW